MSMPSNHPDEGISERHPLSELHPLSERRLPQLDGVRGIAILLVLVFHFVVSEIDLQSNTLAGLAARSLSLTWSGVDLFFVLSGFLIGGTLLDNRGAPNYFKVFYTRRFCRIFPLYYLWIALFVIFSLAAAAPGLPDRIQALFENALPLWSYATFTQNISMAATTSFGATWLGVTWSLAIEEQFYLTLPLIIRFVSPRRLPFVLMTLIAAAPILRSFLLYVSPYAPFANFILMPTRADALLLGVLGAWLVRQESVTRYLSGHTRLLYAGLAVLLAGAGVLTVYAPSTLTLAVTTYGYLWLACLYLCFILIAVTEKRGIITRVTTNPFLRRLGIVAYGMYLFHLSVNVVVHEVLQGQSAELDTGADWAVTLVAFGATFAVAQLSWSLYEKRIVAVGHSFRYKEK